MVYFRKQPYDQISRGFDKTGLLPTGLTISSATVSAINIATGADTTATVLASTTATVTGGTKMQITCQAGTHGEDHKITFRAILSNGERFEEEMTMEVREI